MKKTRIGLFGGTFNPIHRGHLKAASEVLDQFSLDRVLFIPSYIPPHKESSEMAPPHDRLKMVELATAPFPEFLASTIESDAEDKSYSIITLEKVKKIYKEAWIFFILGIDAFLEIDTWKEYEKVLEQCLFIVISRPGYCLDEAREMLGGKYKLRIHSIKEDEEIDENTLMSSKIFLLPIKALDVSSKDIRKKLRERRSIARLVPKAVASYIRENGLYQEGG
jgi:nicotinate-nucleotide adenylyltransferase